MTDNEKNKANNNVQETNATTCDKTPLQVTEQYYERWRDAVNANKYGDEIERASAIALFNQADEEFLEVWSAGGREMAFAGLLSANCVNMLSKWEDFSQPPVVFCLKFKRLLDETIKDYRNRKIDGIIRNGGK